MKTRKIILPIAIVIVVLAGIGLSIGLTYTLWSDTTGGDTSVAPSITTFDWNYYTKYFTYTAYTADGTVIQSDIKPGDTISQRADHFSVTGLTNETLLPDVIFPTTITYKVGANLYTDTITEIGSSLYSEITYKSIPAHIYISPSITKVRQNAFAGLTNLQTVTICATSTTDTHGIRFGYHAFGDCTALNNVKYEGQLSVVFTDLTFAGCSALATLNKGTCNLFYINNIDSTASTTAIISGNWATYKASVFPGTPSSLNPFSA